MDIGKNIAEFRVLCGMTQEELSERLFVSRDLVSKWENGRRRPDYATIEKIAQIFRVPADSIADRNDIVFKELSECVFKGCDVSEEELAHIIDGFLKTLEANESKMFIQRYYYLKSTSDIALAFGIKENHTRTILSRTRRKLRKYVKGCVK